MTPQTKFAIMAGCIYVPLGLGYLSRRLGLLDAEVSRPLSRTVVLTLESFVTLVGFWHLDLSSPGRAVLVPVLGAALSVGLLGVGFVASELLGLRGKRRGAFLLCALMSNIGMSLGGFLCYRMFGMRGQSLAVTYTSHFMPVALLIGLMIATYYATGTHASVGSTLAGMARNPIVIVPNAALVAGLTLNVAAAGPPAWLRPTNGAAVHAAVCLHSYSIGLTLRLGRVAAYWREVVALMGTKFLVGPLWGAALVTLLGQWDAFDGFLWRVVVIEGAMPVAIFATIVSNLFHLDRDLANSAWVLTTLACAGIIPVLCVVTGASG